LSVPDPLWHCRRCWWAAEITRKAAKVWCSHRVHNGWMQSAPACRGLAFRPDDDRPKTS